MEENTQMDEEKVYLPATSLIRVSEKERRSWIRDKGPATILWNLDNCYYNLTSAGDYKPNEELIRVLRVLRYDAKHPTYGISNFPQDIESRLHQEYGHRKDFDSIFSSYVQNFNPENTIVVDSNKSILSFLKLNCPGIRTIHYQNNPDSNETSLELQLSRLGAPIIDIDNRLWDIMRTMCPGDD